MTSLSIMTLMGDKRKLEIQSSCLIYSVSLNWYLKIRRCGWVFKVRKKAKIKNRYNQVPHLTHDTIWESEKNTQENITYKKAQRLELPQNKHRLGMVSKNIFTGGLKLVSWYQPHPLFQMWIKTNGGLVRMKGL